MTWRNLFLQQNVSWSTSVNDLSEVDLKAVRYYSECLSDKFSPPLKL